MCCSLRFGTPQQAIKLDERKFDKELFDSPVNLSMPVETRSKTYIAIIRADADRKDRPRRSLPVDPSSSRSSGGASGLRLTRHGHSE
jgi:hypothetical protein